MNINAKSNWGSYRLENATPTDAILHSLGVYPNKNERYLASLLGRIVERIATSEQDAVDLIEPYLWQVVK